MIQRSDGRRNVDAIDRPTLTSALFGMALFLSPTQVAAQPQQQARTDCHPAAAGGPAEIRIGGCVSGSLRRAAAGASSFDDYRLALRAGDSVQIDMDAVPTAEPAQGQGQAQAQTVYSELDTFLELRRPGRDMPVAQNDDRPGSLNSRILFTASETGDYIVRARGFAGQTGPYTLAVTAVRPPPPPLPFDGDRAEGTITSDNPPSEVESGQRYVVRSFVSATPDARIRIMTRASAGSGRAALVGPGGATLMTSTVGTDSASIVAFLHAPGTYLVRLDLPEQNPPVHYEMGLERATGAAVPPPARLQVGQTADVLLDLDSPLAMQAGESSSPDFFYRLYVLPVQAGQILTLTLDAAGPTPGRTLDPVIDVGAMSPIGFAAASTDDDSGPGLNSRLVVHAEQAGLLYVRARTLGLGLGHLRLGVMNGAQPLPAAAD